MCQTIAQGGRRCASHNRGDELRVQRARVGTLSATFDDLSAVAAAAREEAVMLREDAASAPDDEGAQLNADIAEQQAAEREREAEEALAAWQEAMLVEGLTDIKDRPGYRDDLLAAMPEGARTPVTVDGLPQTAADAADSLIDAQKKAAAASGEAKRLRKIEDDEDTAELEDRKADGFRLRAANLANALRGALGDGVRVTADGIRTVAGGVGQAVGEVLEQYHDGAVEMMEGFAQSVGVNTDVGSTSSAASANGAGSRTDGGDTPNSPQRDGDGEPITKEQRNIDREADEARDLAEAQPCGEFPDGWTPPTNADRGIGGEADTDAPTPARRADAAKSAPSKGDPDDNPSRRDEVVDDTDLSDDDLLAGLHEALTGKPAPKPARTTTPKTSQGGSQSPRAGAQPSVRTAHTPGATPAASAHPPAANRAASAHQQRAEAQPGGFAAADDISDADLLSEIRNLVRAS